MLQPRDKHRGDGGKDTEDGIEHFVLARLLQAVASKQAANRHSKRVRQQVHSGLCGACKEHQLKEDGDVVDDREIAVRDEHVGRAHEHWYPLSQQERCQHWRRDHPKFQYDKRDECGRGQSDGPHNSFVVPFIVTLELE